MIREEGGSPDGLGPWRPGKGCGDAWEEEWHRR
jgi:hypothetical protein